MPIVDRISKYGKFLPSALILLTAFFGSRSGAQRFGSFYLAVAVSVLLILAMQFRLLRKTSKSINDLLWLVMPCLFLVGTFGAVASTSAGLGLFFAVLSSYLFYFYHRHFPSPIPLYIEQTFSLYGAFLLSVFLWGLNFFFTPAWWIMLLFGFISFFPFFWQAFYKMSRSGSAALFDALIVALFVVEMIWAMLYWPVYFFTVAVVMFGAIYLVYMLAFQYFKNRLNRRKIYFQVMVVSFVVLIALSTASWQPIK